jgi:hypothetical protein
MPEVVDIIFEVIFPEISAHVPRVCWSVPKLLQVTPRLQPQRAEACLKVPAVKLGRTPREGAPDAGGRRCVAQICELIQFKCVCGVDFVCECA